MSNAPPRLPELLDQTRLLAVQIRDFVSSCDPLAGADPSPPEANRLVRQLFRHQANTNPGYRQLCLSRGIGEDDEPEWFQMPMVPTAAFKSAARGPGHPSDPPLAGMADSLVFRSSGTTQGEAARSLHINPFPELYRTIIDVGYAAYCLPGKAAAPPTLSLIPSLAQISDSSLGFMANHILERHATSDSVVAFGSSGVDLSTAACFLESRNVDQRPAMVLATAFALVELLDHIEQHPPSSRTALVLPPGSKMFETGGFKGRTREITRQELVERTERLLGIPASSIVREYGMTELTSQMYSTSLLGGDPELLCAPPWLKVSVFDPETLEPVAQGESGLIGFFDLGNVGSYASVLTEDLGRQHPDGLELLGRASRAELRGCSLTVEELQQASQYRVQAADRQPADRE